MNIYLLLATLTIVNAGVVPDTECDGVIIDGKYHDKVILKTGLYFPNSLVVDYNANILYFSHSFSERNYHSALFDLNTKEFKEIDDVPDGFTNAIDQNTHDVYIGGNHGIYKYDRKNNKSELYAAKDKRVEQVFFKDVLYFTDYSSNFIHSYIDGKVAKFNDVASWRFLIDGEDVLYYSNKTGFYAQNIGNKDVHKILYNGALLVKAETFDKHGNAYMCTRDGIYKINKDSLEKLSDLKNCQGLAIDSDNNIIYSNNRSLFLLKFNKDKTC